MLTRNQPQESQTFSLIRTKSSRKRTHRCVSRFLLTKKNYPFTTNQRQQKMSYSLSFFRLTHEVFVETWSVGKFTCKVQRYIGIWFAKRIDCIAPILATIFLCRRSYCECQLILIFGDFFAIHFIAGRCLEDFSVATEPSNVRTRQGFKYALHDEQHIFTDGIFILFDCWLFGKSWWLSSWDSEMIVDGDCQNLKVYSLSTISTHLGAPPAELSKFRLIVATLSPCLFVATARYSPLSVAWTPRISNLAV